MYPVRRFADLAGVTVKTLHHYERRGLLAPYRSNAGYRRYTVRDLARLNRILALKSLGLSLKQIAALLDGDAVPPPDALRTHGEMLTEKRRRLDSAISTVEAIEHDSHPASALRRFVAEAAWARGEAMRRKHAADAGRAPDRASASRMATFREIAGALDRDPSGGAARSLLPQWAALVDRESGGDAGTRAALLQAWANRSHWPEGMRRYVASLYEMEPDAWEKVAEFLETSHDGAR
jgi:MerR family transcriptional regulator, thiopeptide resistance regulator